MLKLFRSAIYILIIATCYIKHGDVYCIQSDDSDGKLVYKRQINDIKITNSSGSLDGHLKEMKNIKPESNNEHDISAGKISKQNVSMENEKKEKTGSQKNQDTKNKLIDVRKCVTNCSTEINVTRIDENHYNTKNHNKDHNGALKRGFYVFLGLSVLVMIYLSFRAFRVRPGASAPTIVRKYGIVSRRSDMELLPLPLNEEEDDDTLFDVGNQMNSHS